MKSSRMMKKQVAKSSTRCVKLKQDLERKRTMNRKVVCNLMTIVKKTARMMMRETKMQSIKTMTTMKKATITSDMIWFVFKIIHLSNPLESATTSTVVLSEFTLTDVDSLTSR